MSDEDLLLPSVRNRLAAPRRELAPVNTRVFDDWDGGEEVVHFHQHQECQPILDDLANRRSADMIGTDDHRHVGSVPFVLLEKWLMEAGVSFSDGKAVQEVVKRKLMDGEFRKLRAWEGAY